MRRIVRDTQERGRSVEEVLDQYHTTVRPMHEAWVEPSKSVADLIVHSSGDSLDVAIQVLKHHVLACVREET
jgi:uridine kinase